MARASNMATQTTAASDAALNGQSNFSALMQAINSCQSALTSKFDSLQLEMGLIQRDINKIRGQVTEAECRVGDMEDRVRDHSATLHTMQVRLKHLESRAEDAKNRNRRNNLRILGLPEGTEGSDTTSFTEKLLHTLFPQAAFLWWSGPTGCSLLTALLEHLPAHSSAIC